MSTPLTSSTMTEATTAAPSTNGSSRKTKEGTTPLVTTSASNSAATPGITAIAAAERANCYRTFGPGYIGTGVAGDLSLELGITTGSGEQQQRSGIGIYLRSDHVAHRYAANLLI
jgi:hypothetical protein